ncbi:hypothetical protein [Bradyrhizobium sp. USDA 4529]
MRKLAKSGPASLESAADDQFEIKCAAEELGRRFLSLKERFDRISRLVPETRPKIRHIQERLNEGNHIRPTGGDFVTNSRRITLS